MADNILLFVNFNSMVVCDRNAQINRITVDDWKFSSMFNELCGLRFSFDDDSSSVDSFHLPTFLNNTIKMNADELTETVSRMKHEGVPQDFIDDIHIIQKATRVPFASLSSSSPASYAHFMIDMAKLAHKPTVTHTSYSRLYSLAESIGVIGTQFVLRPSDPCAAEVTEFDIKSTYPSLVIALGMGAGHCFDRLIENVRCAREKLKSKWGDVLCKRILLITIGYVGGKGDIDRSLHHLREEISQVSFIANVLMTFVHKAALERWTTFYGIVDSIFIRGPESEDMLPFLNEKCDEFLSQVGSKRLGSVVFKREVHGVMRFYRLNKYTFDGDSKTFVKGLTRKTVTWTPDDEKYIVALSSAGCDEPVHPSSWTDDKDQVARKFIQFKIALSDANTAVVRPAVCSVDAILAEMTKAIRENVAISERISEIISFGREDKKTMRLVRDLMFALKVKGL